MSLIFGWYSFTIKSYSPEDFDLHEEKWQESRFEVRQKIFHLFWLPLFSLGKKNCLRYKGELHNAPFEIEILMKAKKVRSPWYSFFIPVVLIVGLVGSGIFIFIAESLMKQGRNSREEAIYETSINQVQNNIDDLDINAYLRVVNLNQYNKGSARFLKLIDKNETEYKFVNRYAIIPYRSNETYYWEQGKDTVTIAINDIRKAVCKDYDSYKERNCGFEILGNGKKYVIDQVNYYDGPVIDGDIDWEFWNPIREHNFYYYNTVFRGDQENKFWTFKLPLQNFGTPANLIRIENQVSEIKWTDSLPLHLKSYEYLQSTYITGSTTIDPKKLQFKSKFIFQDSLKNTYEYIIQGSESRFSISKKS